MKANEYLVTTLADYLIAKKILAEPLVKQAIDISHQQQSSFVSYLVKTTCLDHQTILECCADCFDLPLYQPDSALNDSITENLFPAELARQYRIVPLKKINNALQVGIMDPTEATGLDIIRLHTNLLIFPVLMNEKLWNKQLQQYGKTTASRYLAVNLLTQLEQEAVAPNNREPATSYEEPLIQFVDNMIKHAIQQAASDIHIEPFETSCRIRYRQDGILYTIAEIPASFAARVVTRLKVMAHCDIAERRLPQDGRFQYALDQADIRINSCPTLHGEKAVLRILDHRKAALDIPQLGLTLQQQKVFIDTIKRPQGLILVTGPTGSGKTVTLYSALRYLNTADKNISTIENPVEIPLHGINQVNIHPKIGLNFATALRTLMRQDPDIMMVGEIRDTETADIAIQAAQTGHLILSSLHTNSAIETVLRLQTMGIELYQLMDSISLIISQRLARRLCQQCKIPDGIFFKAKGCSHCLSGYTGRIGIYEFLPLTPDITELFLNHTSKENISTALQRQGISTLPAAAMEKVAAGITSRVEISRIMTL